MVGDDLHSWNVTNIQNIITSIWDDVSLGDKMTPEGIRKFEMQRYIEWSRGMCQDWH